jgi:hypothetical protein
VWLFVNDVRTVAMVTVRVAAGRCYRAFVSFAHASLAMAPLRWLRMA